MALRLFRLLMMWACAASALAWYSASYVLGVRHQSDGRRAEPVAHG
ncbi:MAG: hypothetical protein ACRCS5_12805 [Sphingomonas sp.]|jgi:hypothetical protein|nr:hypothetical protein [Sphingomonas sp. BE137]